jgi:hypothetical protein
MKGLIFLFLLCLLSMPGVFAQPLPPGSTAASITEILYDVPGSDESLEFIELHNTSTEFERNLSYYTFTSGIEFTFPSSFIIPGDAYVLLVKDSIAFFDAFGISGWQYEGDLDDNGEILVLRNNFNQVADSVNYRSTAPWPLLAAGQGHSLTFCVNDTLGNSTPFYWTTSNTATGLVLNGTPLFADPGSACSEPNSVDEKGTDRAVIYPNPTEGAFTVRWPSEDDLHTMEVFDLVGKVVAKWPIPHGTTSFRFTEVLPASVYAVRLIGHNMQRVEPLVVR